VSESTEAARRRLSVLVGEWTTESTHPALPGTVVHGQATFEWLEGERFLIWRERADHPDFPDAIVIIGDTDGLQAHSFDSRGVYRVVETRISDEAWEYLMPREQPSDTAFAERHSWVLRTLRRDLRGRRQHHRRTRAVVLRRRELARRPPDHVPTRIRSSGLNADALARKAPAVPGMDEFALGMEIELQFVAPED
jgi:hypothetical protein